MEDVGVGNPRNRVRNGFTCGGSVGAKYYGAS